MSPSILSGLGVTPTDAGTPHGLSTAILASFQNLGVSPQDFPLLVPRLAESSDHLDLVYLNQSRDTDLRALDIHRFYESRKKEYQDLLEEIKSSRKLLDVLSEFLAQFQGDLSSVSSSIADLQARSKTIENRLEGRRRLESRLGPYISKTVIPPTLIETIMKSEPNERWLGAIERLEVRLMALRTGSTTQKQHEVEGLDRIAEKLRLKASDKIRSFFLDALAPFRLSISSNLQITQTGLLLKYQPLFGFLQRHSARIAHEVQKAYTGTALWYFETSFRRYVRALDKIKSRGSLKFGLLADLSSDSSLLDASIVAHSKLEGGEVILAHMADDPSFLQPPEAMFRSLSLVVIDNALSEWSFLNHFFGHASSEAEQGNSRLTSARLDSSLHSPSPSSTSMVRKPSVANSLADSDSYVTECLSDITAFTEQKSQTVIDLVFKQILAPVFEYHKTFTAKLLSPNDLPDTNSIYAMIQLNEGLITKSSRTNCGTIERHLMGIKMQLWPIFQSKMNQEISSLKAIPEAKGEVDVQRISKRYVYFFSTMVAMEDSLSTVTDLSITKVHHLLSSLRHSLVELIQARAKTLPDLASRKSFLSTVYHDIHSALTAFDSNLVRSQPESAYWKELLWRSK